MKRKGEEKEKEVTRYELIVFEDCLGSKIRVLRLDFGTDRDLQVFNQRI